LDTKDKPYYTYFLRCRDGSLYAGYTDDPEKRLLCHNAGKGAKYTKSRLPVSLVYVEKFATKHEAMSREAALKRLKKAEKERLVQKEE